MYKKEMGLQGMQNQDIGLFLSTDAKPRLKWTPELHQRFVEAVYQLGGADKATPKSLMGVMAIPGLTLYHLKSHLQKYRIGRIQQSCNENEHEDSTDINFSESEVRGEDISGEIMGKTGNQIDETMQIAQVLQMQIEVQKKLHEQVEVQSHLQLRIKAQGKYLQSILKKAQETLAEYNFSPIGVESVEAEASELVTMVDIRCPSSSVSGLTETGGFSSIVFGKRSARSTDCSVDSSLTSSQSSERKDEKTHQEQSGDINEYNRTAALPLLDMNPKGDNFCNGGSSQRVAGRKRKVSTISDETYVEHSSTKRSQTHQEKSVKQLRKFGLSEELDLNSKYQSETDSGKQELDLNYSGEANMFDES